jgi:hypothetical protein
MPAPGQKKVKRDKRLNRAKKWITTYSGGNLIRGYTRWFGVSEVCAIVELRMLGVDIADARLEQAKRNELARAAGRASRKQARAATEGWVDADETFAFIAGYTEGGAPYGIEWDEADEVLLSRRMSEKAGTPATPRIEEDDDLPF